MSVNIWIRGYEDNRAQTRMVLILPEYSQRPYRYGMTLLCVGAMFNWLGLAENNAEPVRYIGVTLIAAGAMLICLAMCFWMKASHDTANELSAGEDQMHHIVTIHQGDGTLEKPPDYDSVTGCSPPCYEDAIRLNPALLLPSMSTAQDTTDSVKPDPTQTPDQSGTSSTGIPKTETTKPSQETTPNPSSESTPTPEESSQNNDNFGSRMLRLSKRFLRGKRGSVSPHGDEANSVEDSSAGEVVDNNCDSGCDIRSYSDRSGSGYSGRNVSDQGCNSSDSGFNSSSSTSQTSPVR
ncbi:uncharacterized protein LOC111052014 isoform X2 [Nilaparvata lugens]|uniref:uncharacterized protein LOC111052014 isoform X2 n=1 Tax=Nilaparvata lugens TaxID=108931 RepID=UPI00193E70A6|nr:uncharacterized protein LOC111052014 isoform X2 [Nilaparvata lugens]